MDARELYNALQHVFCCIICCIRESCRAPRRRWCSSSRSCRRSCRRTSPAVWTMLLPLGDGHRRAERPGCCWCRASSSSLRCGAPLPRQQAMLDKLSRPRRGAAAALSVVNDMGGGHFAINLAASGAQLRPSMGTFTCACAAETVALGAAAMLSCQCADAFGFQSALGFTPPPSLRS